MAALLRFSGAVERDPVIHEWLDVQPGKLGFIARTWFTRIRRCGAEVQELMHDGYPTACVEDAPFAYVGVFKAHVNVGFFHGAALADPARLLQGAGKYMRHVKVNPGQPFDGASLEALITASYRDIVTRLTDPRTGTTIPVHGVARFTRQSPNYYFLCFSNDFDPRLFADFEADACLIVHEPAAFANRLEAAVKT